MMIEHAWRARRPPSPGSPEKAWHALKSKHLSSDLHPKAGRIQKYYQILTKIIKTYQNSVEQNQGRHFLENKKSNANILAKGLGSGGGRAPNIYIYISIYTYIYMYISIYIERELVICAHFAAPIPKLFISLTSQVAAQIHIKGI